MDEAALAEGPREARLGGTGHPGGAVGHDEERIGQAAVLEASEIAVSSLVPGAKFNTAFLAVLGDAPGRASFARQADVQPLDVVHERIGDGEFTEAAGGERLVLLPRTRGHLAEGGATQHT
jgi:hypothetical protein